MPQRPRVGIVTPASKSSNNGNWQTAWRWSRLLAPRYRVSVLQRWAGEPFDALIALHARRSADSIRSWHDARRGPLVLVLTGTDLYRDIDSDVEAQASLQLADRLVVLQELGVQRLPPALRVRCTVSFQSCAARRTVDKTRRHLRALMVGHLRDEKSPETYFDAARLLAARDDILLDHVGATLDAALAARAQRLACEQPRYRWLGALDHATTLRRIQHAHVLVHASRIEGGAHVIAEAVRSGTPVLASRVDGNVGMLGADYAGYFEWHDAAGLAALLRRARDEPDMLRTLARQCRQRARLFEPRRERATLQAMLDALLRRAEPTLRDRR
ncbi:MAG TPA: selenoneine biosynthesis selenosugar synthase SenB [Burkholderiaceae bacterium]|nr:selenoneine biosynthesis selenosugar synthase SenB [Burkholderiaceae bacterium]